MQTLGVNRQDFGSNLIYVKMKCERAAKTGSSLKDFLFAVKPTLSNCHLPKEVLAIRRIFSLVDMITNTKFSNCHNVFKIGVVQQLNMHSKQQNTFQSDSTFTIP